MPSKMDFEAGDFDFVRLRITNVIPTFDDRASIRDIMKGIDNDILHLDQDIATLEDELNRLKVKRATQLKRRSAYASLVSPIRSVPLEILSEIFLYAAADLVSFRVDTSHVCRLWRNAALTTSRLWSTIDGSKLPRSPQTLQEYAHACVDRARLRPLTLMHSSRCLPHPRNALPLILEATQKCAFNVFEWRDVDVKLVQPLQETLASTSCDTLEVLTLGVSWVSSDSFDSFAKPVLNVPLCLKRLSKLSLCWGHSLKSDMLSAPWSQLTDLSISCADCDREALFTIIRQCSNIEAFDFSSDSLHATTSNTVAAHIHLPKLRKLHLYTNTESFTIMADLLVTPLLEELFLRPRNFFKLEEDLRLCQYLIRNAESLRRLWISGISYQEIAEVILQLVHVEELTLVCNETLTMDSLCSLAVPPWLNPLSSCYEEQSEDRVPLPNLRALTIYCSPGQNAQESFAQIIDTRWWPDDESAQKHVVARLTHASLQTIHLGQRTWLGDDVEIWKSQGLDVNVLTSSNGDDTHDSVEHGEHLYF